MMYLWYAKDAHLSKLSAHMAKPSSLASTAPLIMPIFQTNWSSSVFCLYVYTQTARPTRAPSWMFSAGVRTPSWMFSAGVLTARAPATPTVQTGNGHHPSSLHNENLQARLLSYNLTHSQCLLDAVDLMPPWFINSAHFFRLQKQALHVEGLKLHSLIVLWFSKG